MAEEETPIVAGTFDNYLEAEIFCNTLRARGIPAELSGPLPSSGFGLSMGLLSQVSVLVPASAGGLLRTAKKKQRTITSRSH